VSAASGATPGSPSDPRTKPRVAVFGGSFNPPHVAHVMACVLVLSCYEIDDVLVVPAFQHPFAKSLAPFDDRVRMCELAMAWIPRVTVSRVEAEIGGEGKTLHTLEHLHAAHPDWELRLVMGADVLAESSKWFRFDRVRALAPPLVLGRASASGAALAGAAPGPSIAVAPAVLPALSSTEVRTRIAARAWGELRELVPRGVLEYVQQRDLYAAGSPGGDGKAPA